MTTSPALGRATAPAAALVLLLALAGCAGGSPEASEASPTPSETASAAPSPEPSPAPSGDDDGGTATDEPADADAEPFPADTSTDTGVPGEGSVLTVTDVRVGAHDAFDRVVFDLGGTGTPGWTVEYVDEALDDGSGNPVEVGGDAVLQVRISGTAMPMDSGVVEYSGDPIDPGGAAVEQVVYRFVFEGYTTAFIGVAGEPRAFRVFALENPTRVVVDVQH
jgi:hypothetical protein